MGQLFNASEYLLDRRVAAGDGQRAALTGPAGEVSYGDLLDRVCRTARGLREIGVRPEQRILMVMADSPHFVVVYLAAMRVGAIPVPVSTMLHADGIAELLRDSRAGYLAVSREFAAAAESAAAAAPELTGILTDSPLVFPVGTNQPAASIPVHHFDVLAAADHDESVYDTGPDSPAFWLYTSGTTGTPKGAMHRHASIQVVCETYGSQVLGIGPDDRCLSAAKAFFAYGLGNSVLFPMSVGAAAVLIPSPAKPDLIAEAAAKYGATLFFAGPTFFANMLRAGLPPDALAGVRLAASAGEALPASLYERWTAHFGVDILDGIGMTEMLHIFLSNRPGQVRAGTTGVAVPGYHLKLIDEDTGSEITDAGRPGTLFVRGESTATGYWSRYDASRLVYQGEWLRTGDTYVTDADGYYALPRPHRRHDQGQRHVGVAHGGGGPAAGASERVAGGRGRRAATWTASRSRSRTWCSAPARAPPRPSSSSSAGTGCRRSSARAPWCSPTASPPRRPGRCGASSCARWPPRCSRGKPGSHMPYVIGAACIDTTDKSSQALHQPRAKWKVEPDARRAAARRRAPARRAAADAEAGVAGLGA